MGSIVEILSEFDILLYLEALEASEASEASLAEVHRERPW